MLARDRAGELVAVASRDAPPRRVYPLYQVLPGIAGKSLQRVLEVLKGGDQLARADWFLTSENPELGRLAPVEVLLGVQHAERELIEGAVEFLQEDAPTRLNAVLVAAQIYLDIVNGW